MIFPLRRAAWCRVLNVSSSHRSSSV